MNAIRLISRIVAIGLTIVLLVGGFIWLTYRKLDTNTQQVFDIFGRELNQPPIWAKLFLTDEKSWAGTGWFFSDLIIFWLLVFIIFRLFKFSGEHQ